MDKKSLPETGTIYKPGSSSFLSLVDAVKSYSENCSDSTAETRKMALEGICTLRSITTEENALFPGATVAVTETRQLTRTAFSQLNSKLHGPNFDWLTSEDHCDDPLRERVFNEIIRNRENTEVLLRSKGDLIRAVLSDQYSVFDHIDFIDLIERGLSSMGSVGDNVRVHNAQIGDVMRAFILLPDITVNNDPGAGGGTSRPQGYSPNGGGLHPAVYISNSEVGTGKVRLTGGVFRKVCSNGMIMGWRNNSSIAITHRFTNRELVAVEVIGMMEKAFQMSEAAITKFVEAQHVALVEGSLQRLASRWAEKYGLPKEFSTKWEAGAQQEAINNGRHAMETTLFDFLNGATYLAHTADYETAETIQRMAGDLLDEGVPERYRVR